MKNTCPCGTRYEFTELEETTGNFKTYCPKCKMSLGSQELQREINDIIETGSVEKNGWEKKGMFVGAEKNSIIFG